MALIYAEDKDFEKTVEGHAGPKMVAFVASWCPHCHRMMPVLEEAAKLYDGKLPLFVVDVDKAPSASAKYGVRGVPTMLFFKNGDYTQLAGEQPPEALKAKLDGLV